MWILFAVFVAGISVGLVISALVFYIVAKIHDDMEAQEKFEREQRRRRRELRRKMEQKPEPNVVAEDALVREMVDGLKRRER